MPVRQELGYRTVFNILGPLTNPASVKYQLIGVYEKSLALKMIEVLRNLNTRELGSFTDQMGLMKFLSPVKLMWLNSIEVKLKSSKLALKMLI